MRTLQKTFKIVSEKVGTITAEITSENPNTASLVLGALPIKARANRWGDEIYFSTPVETDEENARVEVEVGSVAYWPPGKAVCIFFGKTPVSTSNAPRAASNVNVFAKITGDSSIFKRVRDGDEIILQPI
jgi:hypothetical protein